MFFHARAISKLGGGICVNYAGAAKNVTVRARLSILQFADSYKEGIVVMPAIWPAKWCRMKGRKILSANGHSNKRQDAYCLIGGNDKMQHVLFET